MGVLTIFNTCGEGEGKGEAFLSYKASFTVFLVKFYFLTGRVVEEFSDAATFPKLSRAVEK